MKTTVIFALVCIAFLASCKKDSTGKSYTPECTSTAKTWAADAKPVIDDNCVSCHSGYSTYSGVHASASSIRSSIVDGSMPKGNALSTEQKNSVVCWIDNGAANN